MKRAIYLLLLGLVVAGCDGCPVRDGDDDSEESGPGSSGTGGTSSGTDTEATGTGERGTK